MLHRVRARKAGDRQRTVGEEEGHNLKSLPQFSLKHH